MPRGPQLTIAKRSAIVALYRAGLSYTKISKIEGVKKATIGAVVRRWVREGRLEYKPRSGRPRHLERRDEH